MNIGRVANLPRSNPGDFQKKSWRFQENQGDFYVTPFYHRERNFYVNKRQYLFENGYLGLIYNGI